MSLIKNVTLQYRNGAEYDFQFNNRDCMVLYGPKKLDILFGIESVLSSELYSNIQTKDATYNIKYSDLNGMYVMFENDSFLLLQNNTLMNKGHIPSIHTIRYSGNGTIRSYLFSGLGKGSPIEVNLFEYSQALSETGWYRFISMVNHYLGFKYVELKDGEILFYTPENSFTDQECRLAYLIIGECFLTPVNFKQVILLSNIEFMTKEHQLALMKFLKNIKKVDICISTMNAEYTDIGKTQGIPIVNC